MFDKHISIVHGERSISSLVERLVLLPKPQKALGTPSLYSTISVLYIPFVKLAAGLSERQYGFRSVSECRLEMLNLKL